MLALVLLMRLYKSAICSSVTWVISAIKYAISPLESEYCLSTLWLAKTSLISYTGKRKKPSVIRIEDKQSIDTETLTLRTPGMF